MRYSSKIQANCDVASFQRNYLKCGDEGGRRNIRGGNIAFGWRTYPDVLRRVSDATVYQRQRLLAGRIREFGAMAKAYVRHDDQMVPGTAIDSRVPIAASATDPD